MQKEIIAAIDVGSHALRMKLGELRANGDFKEIESFRKVAALGHDTFTNSKISFESVDKVCTILKAFNNTMNDYSVKNYKALATSAIREASNKEYIIDQIRLMTGIEVEVIDNSEEQYLTHKAIKYKMENYEKLVEEGAVILVVGAGSIQITLFKEGRLISSQNVKIGALRIKEVIGCLENNTMDFRRVLDEYINVNLEGLDFFKGDGNFKHFIAVGGEIGMVKKLIGINEAQAYEVITIQQFEKLFNKIINKNTEELLLEYDIKRERAEVLVPSMMLFYKFLKHTKSQDLLIPNISLVDGIIREIFEELNKLSKKDKANADIITNVRIIAEKFQYNKAHIENVEENAIILFDKLKKMHGLENEKILLRCAAILHDIGKFVGLDQNYLHAYNIIRSLEIFGLSKEQMEVIATIVKYHGSDMPFGNDSSLSEKNRVMASKLIAILKLANSLDKSHKQKIVIQTVKLKERELQIKAESQEKTVLEEWDFKIKAVFFQEVFGVTPVLRIKKEIE